MFVVALTLVVLAIVVVGAVLFRVFKLEVNIPGFGLKLDGSKDSPAQAPGVMVENSKAGRNLTAENDAGTGTRVSGSEAGGDLTATNRREPPHPKA